MYIVGYTVGFFLKRRGNVPVKRDFQNFIRRYILKQVLIGHFSN